MTVVPPVAEEPYVEEVVVEEYAILAFWSLMIFLKRRMTGTADLPVWSWETRLLK